MADVATLIEDCGALKRGKFKLSDGSLTDYYIDKYAFETNPALLRQIADRLADRLDDIHVDVVVGPELGAVPLVTAVSLQTDIPAAFIRRKEDHFGTRARIEGEVTDDSHVVVLEDVTTTGQTIIDAATVVEGVGATVVQLLSVVDRDATAVANARKAGYHLEYLVQIGDNLEVTSSS